MSGNFIVPVIVTTVVSLFFIVFGVVSVFMPRSVIRWCAGFSPFTTPESARDGCMVLQARLMGVVFVLGWLFFISMLVTYLPRAR